MRYIPFLKNLRKYLPQVVYGAVDGTITTFAVVAGATGGQLAMTTILILGMANLFADGASMAISAYLSAKSESRAKQAFSVGVWTFLSFVIFGAVPLLPYFFSLNSFFLSSCLTGVTFVIIGLLQGYITKKSLFFSAFQTLLLGTIAALIAYSVGGLIKTWVG